jgi:hypothetical protein
MNRVRRWAAVSCSVMFLAIPGVAATQEAPAPPIEERARGAARVVVATIGETASRYERNEFGDELIVTYATLSVEEALKGPNAPVTFAFEGGTVKGITMRVSSLPTLEKGERAVFFLEPGKSGEFLPHLRGQGILKLDSANRVPGSSLTLDEIRRLARSSSK